MKYTYPAVFRPDGKSYYIFFPDIRDGATQGEDLNECIKMASDWLAGALYMREKKGENIPAPSAFENVKRKNKDIVTLILADTEAYRLSYENRAIKKTLSIPYWLNVQAEKANINFSQTLQRALKQELQIAD